MTIRLLLIMCTIIFSPLCAMEKDLVERASFGGLSNELQQKILFDLHSSRLKTIIGLSMLRSVSWHFYDLIPFRSDLVKLYKMPPICCAAIEGNVNKIIKIDLQDNCILRKYNNKFSALDCAIALNKPDAVRAILFAGGGSITSEQKSYIQCMNDLKKEGIPYDSSNDNNFDNLVEFYTKSDRTIEAIINILYQNSNENMGFVSLFTKKYTEFLEKINANEREKEEITHLVNYIIKGGSERALNYAISAIRKRHNVDTVALEGCVMFAIENKVCLNAWSGPFQLLHILCYDERFYDILEKCLDRGKLTVDLNSQSYSGETALHWAVQEENLLAVLLLLKHGADVNIKVDNHSISYFNGMTPVHYAVDTGNYEIVQSLLGNNPDLTKRSNNNETALDLAKNIVQRFEEGFANCEEEIGSVLRIITLLEEKQKEMDELSPDNN